MMSTYQQLLRSVLLLLQLQSALPLVGAVAPEPALAATSSHSYHRYHERPAVDAAIAPAVTVTVTETQIISASQRLPGNNNPTTQAAAPGGSTSMPIPSGMSSLSTLAPREIASAYSSAMQSLRGDFAQQMAVVQGNATRTVEDVRGSVASWTMAMSASYRSTMLDDAYTWAYHCNRWKAQNQGMEPASATASAVV